MSVTHEVRSTGLSTEEKIEETRRALAEYQALPLGRKIIQRFTKYPSHNERLALSLHDTDPLDRLREKIPKKVIAAGFTDDKPPFMEDTDSGYYALLKTGKHLYISRYVTVRCNPVVSEFITANDDRRPDTGRVSEPWYAGVYRHIGAKQNFHGAQSSTVGMYLTDKAGVQFEPLEINEATMQTVTPETQQDLIVFVTGISDRVCSSNPRMVG